MATKKEVIEQMDWLTDRMSNQIRTVGLGVLALTWGLLIGGTDAAKAIGNRHHKGLLMVGVLVVISMFLDFLQYRFGYQNVRKLYKSMVASGAEEAKYQRDPFRKAREGLFEGKQIVISLAVFWLVVLLIEAVL